MLAKSLGNRKIVEKSSKIVDFLWQYWNLDFAKSLQKSKTWLGNCTFAWIGSKLELLNVPNAETILLEFSTEFLVGENWRFYALNAYIQILAVREILVTWSLNLNLIKINYLFIAHDNFTPIFCICSDLGYARGYLSIYP